MSGRRKRGETRPTWPPQHALNAAKNTPVQHRPVRSRPRPPAPAGHTRAGAGRTKKREGRREKTGDIREGNRQWMLQEYLEGSIEIDRAISVSCFPVLAANSVVSISCGKRVVVDCAQVVVYKGGNSCHVASGKWPLQREGKHGFRRRALV